MFADKLALGITIRGNFTRSVHLERDQDTIAEYHTTESTRLALGAIQNALLRPSERAITIVGPYGSGKSAFCVHVAQLLRAPEPGRGERKAFSTSDVPRTGLIPVLRVGAPQSLGLSLISALESALAGKNTDDLMSEARHSVPEAFAALPTPRAIADVFAFVAKRSPGGVLLILDEFGKFLEHAARHPGETDPFFLQELAEAAARSEQDKPLIVVTVLHQNMDAYARSLSRKEQNEWRKVAERFRQVSFFPSDRERLEMVGRAIAQTADLVNEGLIERIAEQFCTEYASIPPSLPAAVGILQQWMKQSYPLHPLTFLALPVLFRRVGQSHRSLFSFLNVDEPFALNRFLEETIFDPKSPPLFLPDRLFDYAANVLANGSSLAREWAEAREAVETGEGVLSSDALCVLKTVALLGILRDPRLPASEQLLRITYPEIALTEILGELLQKQRIVFRRRSGTFRIWEGGDVDIEGELQAARSQLIQASAVQTVAELLCKAESQVARRHSYQTGTLRQVRFVPCTANDLAKAVEIPTNALTVLLCLGTNDAELAEAEQFLISISAPNVLVALARETETLQETALDTLAATRVFAQVRELEQDRASRRELATRHSEAQEAFQIEWRRLFAAKAEGGEGAVRFWYAGTIQSIPEIGPFLSDMADRTFWKTPRFKNELVNRRAISSQAAAARRNLIQALIDPKKVTLRHLDIQGFPPERSMYESLLSATGLHQKSEDGSYRLVTPREDNSLNLSPVWQEMERLLLDEFVMVPIPVHDLFRKLSDAPFGLTEGVLPILLCVFLQVYGTETTFYRENTFVPEPGTSDWELLLRRPEQFAVAGCRVSGERKAIVERLAAGLQVEPSTVSVVRALLRQTKGMPDYSQKTRRLSVATQNVRQAFSTAKSPEQLLFVDLPNALGLTGLFEGEFFDALNGVFREWMAAYPALIAESRDKLTTACGLPTGDTGFEQLREEARNLEKVLGFAPAKLLPFLRRAALPGDTATVLDGVLAQVGDRPPRTWDDMTVAKFNAQALVIGDLFREMVAQSGSFTEPELVADEKTQRDQLVMTLRSQLGDDLPPRLIRATLLQLLRDLPSI